MSQLEGKVSLVTGGNRGIGLGIATALAKAGSDVVICGRDPKTLESAEKDLGCKAIPCDVRRYAEVERLFQEISRRHGGLDILINNAGLGIFSPVSDLTPEQWLTVIETNLNGVFYCCHEAIPLMRKRGGGYIVNISSLAGKNPLAGGAAYNASKFGLNGFSEALMLDVRYDNIRVSYIMPGSVETEFSGHSTDSTWKIQPADIAETVIGLITLPDRSLASRVEMRPSKPPRK